jgi:hypothetical protein
VRGHGGRDVGHRRLDGIGAERRNECGDERTWVASGLRVRLAGLAGRARTGPTGLDPDGLRKVWTFQGVSAG